MPRLFLGNDSIGFAQGGEGGGVAAGLERLPVRPGDEAVAVVCVDHLQHRRARVGQRGLDAPRAVRQVRRVRDAAVAGEAHAGLAEGVVGDEGEGGDVGGRHGAEFERHCGGGGVAVVVGVVLSFGGAKDGFSVVTAAMPQGRERCRYGDSSRHSRAAATTTDAAGFLSTRPCMEAI
ncbi:hypothetical protein BKA80DRAFT_123028 [Phyllosticta citrichinensis]